MTIVRKIKGELQRSLPLVRGSSNEWFDSDVGRPSVPLPTIIYFSIKRRAFQKPTATTLQFGA